MFKIFLFSIILFATFSIAQADEFVWKNAKTPNSPNIDIGVGIVQQDVSSDLHAVYAGDIDNVLSYTHPKIIEMMGGETTARETLSAVLVKFQNGGLSLKSLTFPKLPTFINTTAHHFVIVPTLTIMSAHGKRVESLNYQFGIKGLEDKKWTYIEGSRINKSNVQALFPDFPSNYEFPQVYRKLIQ